MKRLKRGVQWRKEQALKEAEAWQRQFEIERDDALVKFYCTSANPYIANAARSFFTDAELAEIDRRHNEARAISNAAALAVQCWPVRLALWLFR